MRENSNRISTQMSLEEKLLNNRAFDRIGAPLIRSDKENRHREKKSILTTFIFGLFLKKVTNFDRLLPHCSMNFFKIFGGQTSSLIETCNFWTNESADSLIHFWPLHSLPTIRRGNFSSKNVELCKVIKLISI